MIVIIAHHYVVNSGLMEVIQKNPISIRSVGMLIFGWGGKYGINCFLMITGYFMCKLNITLKKFLKLLFDNFFNNWVCGFFDKRINKSHTSYLWNWD